VSFPLDGNLILDKPEWQSNHKKRAPQGAFVVFKAWKRASAILATRSFVDDFVLLLFAPLLFPGSRWPLWQPAVLEQEDLGQLDVHEIDRTTDGLNNYYQFPPLLGLSSSSPEITSCEMSSGMRWSVKNAPSSRLPHLGRYVRARGVPFNELCEPLAPRRDRLGDTPPELLSTPDDLYQAWGLSR